ncbi:uncharacterized protein LOC128982730 [Macrosteles quadrilineatus]|uniref:uncharacterized protein LOC128982730 n=1 Tax=Macrosteles quadrilineatus TaxID=74068 RepID=UPI0023E1F27F|nr:uncharacterized protein LOC128982730 [Macrosteles quadrilineatus]
MGGKTRNSNPSNPTNFKEHTQPPNEVTKEVTKVRLALREASQRVDVKPVQALATTLRDTPDYVKAQLGKLSTIRRDLRKQRERSLPALPRNVTELEISPEFAVTGGEDSRPFLIHDSGPRRDRGFLQLC